jgi:hypothetical protein
MDWKGLFVVGGDLALYVLENMIVKEYEKDRRLESRAIRVRDAHTLSSDRYAYLVRERCLEDSDPIYPV